MAIRVLCVDDEPSGLYFRKLVLEQQGYEVDTATNPADALEKFRTHRFDIVVTDHLLGRGTGAELARQLKKIQPKVPIILLSGTTDVPLETGVVSAFLSKTEGPEALLQTIAELIPASASQPEQQLLQAEPLQSVLLTALIESSDDAIFSKALDGTILTWNRAAQRMYGYTPEEIIGRKVSTLFPPELHGEFEQIMERIRHGERVDHLLTRRRAKDGRELAVMLTIFPVRDQQGHILSAATIARDITQLTMAQEALRNSDRLATAGRMAATVAHEINNPLEAVTNILYLLDKAPGLDPTAREFLTSAQQEIARIRQIAQLTLKYHRQPTSHIEQVRIPELVEGIAKLYGRRLRTLGIELETKFDGEGTVEGYAGELRQVISNLIVNAMDALEEKGSKLQIRVRDVVDRAGRAGVRVTVADNAGGIAKEHIGRVFEPFYSTKGENGTGVGLWVSSGIVAKHGGSIRVRSKAAAGRSGTVFSVFLPQRFPHEQTSTAA
jgi:two-component system, chemotaxis family, CheB/CheR fusion protein